MRSFDRLLSLLSEIPDPRRAEGKLYKLPHVSAVLDPCRCHRRQFLSFHRDLHQGTPPQIERRLRSALEACAGAYRHSIHPSGPRSAGGRAGFPPPRRWSAATPQLIRRNASSRSMEKHSGEASTISTTARRPNCCTRSTPKPAWFWRTSISRRSPTRSPPRRSCLANSVSRTASSLSMRCTAKKNLRGRRAGAGTGPHPTKGKSAHPAAKCRNRLCLREAPQQ